MSGRQTVLNHLRFARHWLTKAEGEFQRQETAQGELTLSLAQAEVKKAWLESRSGVNLVRLPGLASPARRRWWPLLGAGSLAAALVVAGGLAVWRVSRPAALQIARPPALPGAERRKLALNMDQPAARPLPSPPEAPVSFRPAEKTAPARSGKASESAPARKAPEAPPVRRVASPPPAQVAAAARPVREAAPAMPAAPARETAPAKPPETAATTAPAAVAEARRPASTSMVRPAAAEQPPAPQPAAVAGAAPVTQPAFAAAAPAAGAPRPAPKPASVGEGGGTPLPLDLAELVRVAERSLQGRP